MLLFYLFYFLFLVDFDAPTDVENRRERELERGRVATDVGFVQALRFLLRPVGRSIDLEAL